MSIMSRLLPGSTGREGRIFSDLGVDLAPDLSRPPERAVSSYCDFPHWNWGDRPGLLGTCYSRKSLDRAGHVVIRYVRGQVDRAQSWLPLRSNCAGRVPGLVPSRKAGR